MNNKFSAEQTRFIKKAIFDANTETLSYLDNDLQEIDEQEELMDWVHCFVSNFEVNIATSKTKEKRKIKNKRLFEETRRQKRIKKEKEKRKLKKAIKEAQRQVNRNSRELNNKYK